MQTTTLNSVDSEQYLYVSNDNKESTLRLFEEELFKRMINKKSLGDDYVNSSNEIIGTVRNENPDDSEVLMREHIMINNLETDMGPHWGISSVYCFENIAQAINDSSWSYRIGNLSGSNYIKQIKFDDEAATYYDANVSFTYSDTMDGSANSVDKNLKIIFDTSPNSNYNAFKAVNSSLSRLDSNNSPTDEGLRYVECKTFNEAHSLLSNKQINREPNGQLVAANTSYQNTNNVNISVVDADNSDVLFGVLELEQPDLRIEVLHDTSVESMTLVDSSDNTSFSNLPTALTTSQFNDLFDENTLSKVGPGYKVTITSESSGSYNLDFVGFTLDDTDIKRNVKYMSTLKPFTNVTHTIEMTNGTFTAEVKNNNFMFELQSGDEKLDSSNYNQNGSFSTFAKNAETRAVASSDVFSESIPSLRITYPNELLSANVGSLDTIKMTTYDVNYDIRTIIPSTDSNSSYLIEEMIDKSDSFVAVITDENVNLGLFDESKISFLADKTSLLNMDRLNLFQIKQEYNMTEETGAELYYIDGSNNMPYVDNSGQKALISATATNVKLHELVAQDVRVKISPKTLNDITNWEESDITPKWIYTNSDHSVLQSQKDVREEFMNNNIYKIFDNKLEFTYILNISTNTKAKNIESLNFIVEERYSFLDGETQVSGGIIHDENDLVMIVDSASTVDTFIELSSNYTGIPVNCQLRMRILKQRIKFQIHTKFGPFNNLSLETQYFDSVVLKPYIYNTKLDKPMPDGYLKNAISIGSSGTFSITVPSIGSFSFSGNKCIRVIENTINSSNIGSLVTRALSEDNLLISSELGMNHTDLYGFKGIVQAFNSDEWFNLSLTDPDGFDALNESEYMNVDVVFDNVTTFLAGSIPLSLKFMCDIPVDAVIPLSPNDSTVYYVDLSNEEGSSTFTVTGKSYTNDELAEFTSDWNPHDDSSAFFPNLGVAIGNLTTLVTKIDKSNNPGDQNQIKLEIIRRSFGGADLKLFTFISDINIAANFNVIYNTTPLLAVTETIGEDSTTMYVSTQTYGDEEHRYIKVADGVEVRLMNDSLKVGDSANFTLLGDEVQCKPYPNYVGAYSTRTEITPELGLAIGDELCRNVLLNYYRGVISNETIPLLRTPTTITFVINKASAGGPSSTYSQNLGNLYVGSSAVVNNLSVLGNLGLIVNGNYSMFDTSTIMEQIIDVQQGSYKILISNPLQTELNKERIIYTNEVDIQLFESKKMKASRVKIYDDESYEINFLIPDLIVRYMNVDAVGANASTMSYTNADVHSFTDSQLRQGVRITNKDTNSNSQLNLLRTILNVQSFVEHYSLTRPQFQLESISTNTVTSVPYNALTVARQVYFQDINHESTGYNPFASISGLNNIELIHDVTEKYTDKRLLPNSDYDYFNILSNTVSISTSIGTSVTGQYPIYVGKVNEMPNANVIGEFESNYTPSTGIANLNFKQPMRDLVSSDIAEQLKLLNIKINGVHIFGTGTGQINIYPRHGGNSVRFKLYGYQVKNDNGTIQVVFCMYETEYGFDFFNDLLQTMQVTKCLKFYALSKFETVVEIPPNEVLTDVPYNLAKIIETVELDPNWSWTKIEDFVPRQLKISLSSLSTTGLNIMGEWINVDNTVQSKTLLFETPDLFSYKSLDGSLIARLTYSGALIVPVTITYQTVYGDPVPPFSNTSHDENINDELFAYNIISLGTL